MDPYAGDDGLSRVATVFRLNSVERHLLVIAAAPDLDPVVAAAFGALQGRAGAQPATIALALELAGIPLLSGPGRALLGRSGTLLHWGLVQTHGGPMQLNRNLSVPEDVLGTLLNHPVADALSAELSLPIPDFENWPTTPAAEAVAAGLRAGEPTIWVEESPGSSGGSTAMAGFAQAQIRCVAFDLTRRRRDQALTEVVTSLVRRAGLLSAGLILVGGESLLGDPAAPAAVRALMSAPLPVVLVGRCRWNPVWQAGRLPQIVRAQALTPTQRTELWRRHLSVDDVSSAALAGYRLTPEQIDTAGRHVAQTADLFAVRPDVHMLTESVRVLGGDHRVRRTGWTRTSFDDLQVPQDTRLALERLAGWVAVRDEVIGRGQVHGVGGKGGGIVALFTGSPGTGKTLAANVIADTAGLDLMQVDLSGVIDKYIGETEKNLERIFAEAETMNVVLFFDEADALFGSRSAVRESRDRYANQEVSYLLQRMESFDGVTVLATNLRGNLDAAFSRRMHFIVHFPDPDEPTRKRLWEKLIGMAGVTDDGDPIQVGRLASLVDLAGGDMKNIILSACYDAAIERAAIGNRHVVAATVREYAKLGRRLPAGL